MREALRQLLAGAQPECLLDGVLTYQLARLEGLHEHLPYMASTSPSKSGGVSVVRVAWRCGAVRERAEGGLKAG